LNSTEWDDILRKKGIIPEDPAAVAREAAAAVVALAEEAAERVDPLARLAPAELDALEEDDAELGDSRAVDAYRAARVAEIKARAARARFGAVRELSRPDFVREVNEASADGTWVLVHLHQEYVDDSRLLARALAGFAAAQPAVKCLVAKADACVDNFPDKNVPTLLIYHNGELAAQLVTLAELGGARVNKDTLEWVLSKKGACATELDDDPREELRRAGAVFKGGVGAAGALQRNGAGTFMRR
jgi:hypothetical protein